VQEEEVLHQRAALLIYSRQPPPTLFGENRANQQIMNRLDTPNHMTSHQQQGRDITDSVLPGKDKKHSTHPVSPPLTRVGTEQGQSENTQHTVDQVGRQRDLQRFQESLRKKLTRSSTEWTPLLTITQWLSGQNRQRPCQSLLDLEPHQIQTWIGQEQDITSYIKSRDFILVKQTTNGVLLDLRPSATTPTAHPNRQGPPQTREPREEGRRVVIPPPTDLPTIQKKNSSIANCPKDTSWEEATEARLNLLDHLVQVSKSPTQGKGDLAEQEKWLDQRIRHNVKGIVRDISPSVPLPDQLLSRPKMVPRQQSGTVSGQP
jgi:hypothetical protein